MDFGVCSDCSGIGQMREECPKKEEEHLWMEKERK